jgi:hypothetical protein
MSKQVLSCPPKPFRRERVHAPLVTCPRRPRRDIVATMTHFPQVHPQRRSPRIQLGGSVLALVILEDGRRAKAKLQTVSVTGGLLRLAKSLTQGDFVEVAFQTQSGAVRGMAEMLTPVRATTDVSLQPFRFVALGDDDHRALRMVVDSAADRSFQGIRSSQWAPPKSF